MEQVRRDMNGLGAKYNHSNIYCTNRKSSNTRRTLVGDELLIIQM